VSVLLMSLGSLLIALLPGYHQIGLAAPLVLLVARMIQGLSVGGEYGASATYLSEVAHPEKRGFFASFQYVTLIGGQLLALGLQLILQQWLNKQELHDWGWRIPFVVGALLSLVALYLRAQLPETEAFKQEKQTKGRGQLKALFQHPRAIATVAGLTLGGTLAFYTYTTYMQKFLVNTAGFTKDQSTQLSFLSLLLFALLQPAFGWLSDKTGRKPLLIGFGVLGTLCTVPLFNQLSHVGDMSSAFLLLMASLIIVSGYTSINAVVKAELFPAEVRALGVGFPYAITVAIFGGTAEYIALWAKNAGHESWFYWYVTSCIFISLLVYFFMQEPIGRMGKE
ncbi:MAG: MFS transporter, partial [Bacteroidota bacterium]|nr:MFS transporter [Bacteroidota bacterium]